MSQNGTIMGNINNWPIIQSKTKIAKIKHGTITWDFLYPTWVGVPLRRKCAWDWMLLGSVPYSVIFRVCSNDANTRFRRKRRQGERRRKDGTPHRTKSDQRGKKSKLRGKSTGSRGGLLCTNSCPVADLWSNCAELHDKWSNGWLCKVRARIGWGLSSESYSAFISHGLKGWKQIKELQVFQKTEV